MASGNGKGASCWGAGGANSFSEKESRERRAAMPHAFPEATSNVILIQDAGLEYDH